MEMLFVRGDGVILVREACSFLSVLSPTMSRSRRLHGRRYFSTANFDIHWPHVSSSVVDAGGGMLAGQVPSRIHEAWSTLIFDLGVREELHLVICTHQKWQRKRLLECLSSMETLRDPFNDFFPNLWPIDGIWLTQGRLELRMTICRTRPELLGAGSEPKRPAR